METIQSEKEKMLWKQAKARVSFKNHLLTYLIINSFLWLLWALGDKSNSGIIPWPAYSTLGWGIGIAFSYVGAYHSKNNISRVEEEYNKLLEKNRV
ncbi:MAG: 2TM domain-containing protein [Bacteroidia bacterium]|nr:2TM domain-containing protein [Bacteroidia bacterium]